MKPVKNRVYCQDCGRIKMLFDSEEKANRFIKYNKDEIESENGKSPVRAYNCKMCGGWHVTSKQESKYIRKSIGERLDDNIDQLKSLEQRFNEFKSNIKKMTIQECFEKIDEFRMEIDELKSNGLVGLKLVVDIGYKLTNIKSKLSANTNKVDSTVDDLINVIKEAYKEKRMNDVEETIELAKSAVTDAQLNGLKNKKVVAYRNVIAQYEKIIEDYKNKVKSEENSNDANLKIIYDAIVTDYKNKQYVDCEKRVVEMIGELKKEPLLGQKKRKQYYNQLVVYCSNLKIKIDSNVGESLPNEFKGKISICCASTQEFEKRIARKRSYLMNAIDEIYDTFTKGNYDKCENLLVYVEVEIDRYSEEEKTALSDCIEVLERYNQLISPYLS